MIMGKFKKEELKQKRKRGMISKVKNAYKDFSEEQKQLQFNMAW